MSSLPPILAARIKSEVLPLLKSPPPSFTVHPSGSSSTEGPNESQSLLSYNLTLTIDGSECGDSTPFKGRVFEIVLNLGKRYPFEPPSVRFVSKILHPNISPSGIICLTTLKPPPAGTWTPKNTIYNVCSSIKLLVLNPSWDDVLEGDVKRMWEEGTWENEARTYGAERGHEDLGGDKKKRKLDDGGSAVGGSDAVATDGAAEKVADSESNRSSKDGGEITSATKHD